MKLIRIQNRAMLAGLFLSSCLSNPLAAASVQPIGGPFGTDIVSVFIPPTRSDNPVVATQRTVHQWDDEALAWRSLYSPPWATARVLAVAGYEKSSKALYVAHSGGVACSGDGGESWTESVPPGYAPGGPVRIVINPLERRHAVVETGGRAWETIDFGESWSPLPLEGAVNGTAFLASVQDEPQLLAAGEQRLTRMAGAPLRPVGHFDTGEAIAGIVPHVLRDPVFLQFKSGRFAAVKFDGSGNGRILDLPGRASGSLPVACAAGSSSLITAAGKSLHLASLTDSAVPRFEIGGLPAEPTLLEVHPRRQDALFLAADRQLYLLENAFEGSSPGYIQSLAGKGLPERDIAWRDAPPTGVAVKVTDPHAPAAAPADEEPMEAAIALARVLAGEPGLDQTVRKALEFERSQPGVFAEWMQKVRKRHYIPNVRIQGGIREYAVDDALLVTSTDPFGFESLEDYRLPDQIRALGYIGIVLQWPLDSLVFDPDIIEISRERRQFFSDRRELVGKLGELYYQRIRLITEAQGLLGQPSQAQKLKLLLEIHQVSEVLNGFCGEQLFNPMPIK